GESHPLPSIGYIAGAATFVVLAFWMAIHSFWGNVWRVALCTHALKVTLNDNANRPSRRTCPTAPGRRRDDPASPTRYRERTARARSMGTRELAAGRRPYSAA